MKPRIEIDPNVRIRGNKTYAGYEDVQRAGQLTRTRTSHADAPVAIGQHVLAWESEDDIVTDAVVVDIDTKKQFIILAVEWRQWRTSDEEQATAQAEGLAAADLDQGLTL